MTWRVLFLPTYWLRSLSAQNKFREFSLLCALHVFFLLQNELYISCSPLRHEDQRSTSLPSLLNISTKSRTGAKVTSNVPRFHPRLQPHRGNATVPVYPLVSSMFPTRPFDNYLVICLLHRHSLYFFLSNIL